MTECSHGKVGPCRLQFGRGCRWADSCRFCHLGCAKNDEPASSFITPDSGACCGGEKVVLVLEPVGNASEDPESFDIKFPWKAVPQPPVVVVIYDCSMPAKWLSTESVKNAGVLSFVMSPEVRKACGGEDATANVKILCMDEMYDTGLRYTFVCNGSCQEKERAQGAAESTAALGAADRLPIEAFLFPAEGECKGGSVSVVLLNAPPTYIVSVDMERGGKSETVSSGPLDQPYRWSSARNPGRFAVAMPKHRSCGDAGCKSSYNISVKLFGRNEAISAGTYTYVKKVEAAVKDYFPVAKVFNLENRIDDGYQVTRTLNELAAHTFLAKEPRNTRIPGSRQYIARFETEAHYDKLLTELLMVTRVTRFAQKDFKNAPLLMPTVLDFGFVRDDKATFAALILALEGGQLPLPMRRAADAKEWALLAWSLACTLHASRRAGIRHADVERCLVYDERYVLLFSSGEEVGEGEEQRRTPERPGIKADMEQYARVLLGLKPPCAACTSLETLLEDLCQERVWPATFLEVAEKTKALLPPGTTQGEWDALCEGLVRVNAVRLKDFDDTVHPQVFQEVAQYLNRKKPKKDGRPLMCHFREELEHRAQI